MPLKRDTPPEVAAAIQAIEDRGDKSFANLEIYTYPRELAAWAVLVFATLKMEEMQVQVPRPTLSEVLLNLGMRGSLVLQWIADRCKPHGGDGVEYRLSPHLSRAVTVAMEVAGRYDGYRGAFPMWHRNRYSSELLADGAVRFSDSAGGLLARRISAFQKGFTQHAAAADGELLPWDRENVRLMEDAFSTCFISGHESMAYAEPEELYRSFFDLYLARMGRIFRRAETLALGGYSMGEFKQAYAALSAVVGVHDFVNWKFGQLHWYPRNSCVMVRPVADWVRLLSRVSGLKGDVVNAAVGDLTLQRYVWDLHIHPLVQLEPGILAVAPPFPLGSRADENLMRVINHTRRRVFDRAAQLKEKEMVEDLGRALQSRFAYRSGISLPDGLPNIDFLIADEATDSVLIAELKWLQKPLHWKERLDREAGFDKGIEQLSRIKGFLALRPTFLTERGVLPRHLGAYGQVAYVLIARDFFAAAEASATIVVDHDVFKQLAHAAKSLRELIGMLESRDWLPVEGRHFRVEFNRLALNGGAIETEVFYRTRGCPNRRGETRFPGQFSVRLVCSSGEGSLKRQRFKGRK